MLFLTSVQSTHYFCSWLTLIRYPSSYAHSPTTLLIELMKNLTINLVKQLNIFLFLISTLNNQTCNCNSQTRHENVIKTLTVKQSYSSIQQSFSHFHFYLCLYLLWRRLQNFWIMMSENWTPWRKFKKNTFK